MNTQALSRRVMLRAGAFALPAALGIPTKAGARGAVALSATSEVAIRKYYKAWEQKDWQPFDGLLASDFTFTSPNNDDHISKYAFKERCWRTQRDFIDHFDLLRVFGRGSEALVLYVCHTTNAKTFRNVEYVRVNGDHLEAIECYFGAPASFASAVGTEAR